MTNPIFGDIDPSDFSSQTNSLSKVITTMVNRYSFIELVQIKAISGKTCTVLPLTLNRRADGVPIDNVTISNIPFFRLQMGSSAVIINPKVGDIGLLLSCDKDTSAILSSGSEALPATGFVHNRQDGIYLGGVALLNGTPTEYIEFTGSGVNLVAPAGLNITANTKITGTVQTSSTIHADGDISTDGNSTSSGNITTTSGDIKAGSISLKSHFHSNVESGSDNSGGPVAS